MPRTHHHLRVVILVGLTMVVSTNEARPCSCIPGLPKVLPNGDVAAPTNTHIWVFVPPTGDTYDFDQDAPSDIQMQVMSEEGDPIPVERIDWTVGSQLAVELAPRAPLDPNREYLVLLTPTGPSADTWKKRLDLVALGYIDLGGARYKHDAKFEFRFTTGPNADNQPPRFKTIKWARLSPEREAVTGMCDTGWLGVRIALPDSFDEPRFHPSLFGVSIGDGEVQEADRLTGLLLPYEGVAYLGWIDICSPRTLLVPSENAVVAIQRIDLAGNRSAPLEIRFPGDRAVNGDLIGQLSTGHQQHE